MSASRWKALLIALTFFSVAVMVIESVAAVAASNRGTRGRLGIQSSDASQGGHAGRVVRGFESWSHAPQAGVQVGDLMRFDRWHDRGRDYQPGETVGFSVVRDGLVLAVRVPVVERPIENLERWHFGANAVLCGLGTLLGLVIGLRQAEVTTSRASALALRAGRAVARRDAVHSALTAELAIVFSRPRELEAFVLVGAQRDGRVLRSDAVAALRDALEAAGLEWHALRWAEFQRHPAP